MQYYRNIKLQYAILPYYQTTVCNITVIQNYRVSTIPPTMQKKIPKCDTDEYTDEGGLLVQIIDVTMQKQIPM